MQWMSDALYVACGGSAGWLLVRMGSAARIHDESTTSAALTIEHRYLRVYSVASLCRHVTSTHCTSIPPLATATWLWPSIGVSLCVVLCLIELREANWRAACL